MEFTGVNSLNSQTAEQLSRYLVEKESDLSLKILNSTGQMDNTQTFLPQLKAWTLAEAVIAFGKKIRSIHLPQELFKDMTSTINEDCWQYLEILENSITELFSELKLCKAHEWTEELFLSVQSIKMTLMHHLEELEWSLKRLNALLRQYRYSLSKKNLWEECKKLFSYFDSDIDRSIIANVQKSQKFLSFQEGKFRDEYNKYQTLKEDVKKHNLKFQGYKVLDQLHFDSKEAFLKVYELLKMWGINEKSKLIPSSDLEVPLKSLQNPKRMFHIFEEYHLALQKELFDKSRQLKSESKTILEHDERKKEIEVLLLNELKEIHLLHATVTNYREFLLKSDPDPYVRCRFGFPEWIVGVEPALTKNMLLINYDIEETHKYVEEMINSLKIASSSNETNHLKKVMEKNEELFHKMSQPLMTKATTKELAEKVLGNLKELKELSSLDIQVVDFIGNQLLELLKADGQDQNLFDISEFEKIYSNHVGLLRSDYDDRLHLNRLNELKRLCIEIKNLVKKKSFYKDSQEVEWHLNDIKGSLQDFLGAAQRAVSDKDNAPQKIRNIRFQLLEYRYFFGHYFHELKQLDGSSILQQFHFVGQYLNAVDDALG